ncbi:MAG: MFS transporter [Rhodobiaceae bacterium]|nr:MFS transporter [Novosphingobium sp.]MCC0057595.1 MFS transporter [Rhodobiaceae bacterium]
MDLMDTASLALALPTIAGDFGISTTDLRLVLTVYAITVAALVPASGWIADCLGARRVFVGAMIVFVIGSVLCGMAQDLTQLVFSRILQGTGGAMMTPVGRAIMVGSVNRHSMVRAMAWYTLPAILAPLLGPPLAGTFIELASWRWIFFVNVPVSLLGIAAVMRFVPKTPPLPRRNLDVVGFLLCGATILAVLGIVETGGLSGQPLTIRILGGCGAIVLLFAYVLQALKAKAPLIDLRVLRHKSLSVGLAAGGLQRIGIGAITIVLPMHLQVALGLSPLVASQVPAVGAVGSILSRFACPFGLRLMGFRPLMIGAALVLAVATLIPVSFGKTTPVIAMAAFLACYALVRATFFMSANSLSYADVESVEISNASVLFSISQQLTLGLGYTLGGGLVAVAGGAKHLGAYAIAYPAIALLPLAAALIVAWLPQGVGDTMRQKAAP